jgi:formylmethanofuran dehydrogenase subunit C
LTGVRCTTVVAMVDYNPTTAFTASPLGSLKSSGAAVLTHTVQYDSNQRITISGSGNGQRTFFYDSVGNLSFKGLLWYENYHVPRIQLTVSGVFPVLVTANTWVHSPSGQLFNVGGSATLLSRQGLVYIGNGGKQQGLFLANDSVVQGFGYQTSNDNTSDFIAGQSSLPTPGQWYSVVLKRVNDTVYLFVNGTLITQSSNPSAVAEYGVNPQVWIGKWIYSYFNGKIDDVRIYSRGLTTTDIQSLASGDDLSNASFTYVPHFAHESRGRLFVKGVTAEHYYFSPSGTLQVSGRFGFSGDTISPLFAISDGTSSQALVLTRNYETSPTMVGLGFLSSNDDDTNYHDSVGTNPPVNQWMHLSMVRTATDIKLYVNGTLVSTTPVTKLATFGSNPKAILAHLFDNFFKGKLDDARFYLRALSANEVGSLSQGHELSTASFIYDVKHYHESEGRLRLRGVYPERNILFFDAVGTLRVTGYFTLDNGTVQYVPRGRIRFVGLGKVKIDTPQEAGGLLGVLDGLAEPNAVTVRYRASGRVRLSGISELMSGIHRHEGSGMLTLRGRSTFYTRPFIQSRGKLKFTGVAEVALLAPYEASGALGSYRIEELRGIRGIATVFFVPATVGFGKLTFNGYAEHFTLPFVKPNSGFRLRGTADVSVNPVREGHVKVVLSGISSCQSGFIFNSGGDLQLSGSCEDAYFTGPLFVPSGRLRFVGRAPFTLSGTIPVSSVTLTLSGGATTNHGPSSEPLGKVTLSGIAGYQVTATCEPTGRLTTSGVGVEVHHAASGKLVVSGETVVTFGVIQISAGKLTLSGVCTLNYGIRYEALGRLLFAGEAGQKAWTHVTSGRLVVSGTGETTSATVLPATGAIAVSGVSTTRTTAIVSPVGFLIVSGNTSLHYTVEPVGSIVIAGTSGAVVLSYVHVPTGKLTITGVCGLTGIAYVIVTASGSIRVSGNNQLGAHYSFLPAGVLATLGGISGSHESGAESSIPVLPEAGIPGVFQRGCLPWIDQESFFKMINPNHEIWGVLNQLTFSGWEFVCFNRKTREGTIKIGQRVYVITVTDLGSRTPVRESTPTVEQRSTDVNRSGAGFVDKVPVKTVCGSISNRDLLNLIPESSVKTYLEGLDMSEWRVVCFDRKTRRAELQIQNRRVAITVPDINIHVNDSQSTSSPQESDSQGFGMVGPVAVSAEQNKPVSAGKVDNSLKISQDKFIKIINNQEIRKVLLGLPKDQWQINKYDGKRRKAEIRIQNRYITVAV